MDSQLLNTEKQDLQKEIAKSVGRDITPIAPDKTEFTEKAIEAKQNYLKEKAKDIILLDQDSTKKAKVFNCLLEIKEKYPKEPLAKFVEYYFKNNGKATNKMINFVENTANQVEQYYQKSTNKDNFENDWTKVEKFRGRMLRALEAVGITYKNRPSTKTVAEDFYNIILKDKAVNSFDFQNFADTITNVGNSVTSIANTVGQTVNTVQNIADATKNRNDLYFNPPVSAQQAESKFLVSEKKAEEKTNYLLWGGIGVGVIVLLIILIKVIK